MFHLLFYLVWITCILTALKPTVIVSSIRINPVKTLHEFTHYTRLRTIFVMSITLVQSPTTKKDLSKI